MKTHFSLRKKVFLISLGVSVFISCIIGITIFSQAYRLFLSNFRQQKLSLAEAAAGALESGRSGPVNSSRLMADPLFLKDQEYLRRIKKQNPDISYLYTVMYDAQAGFHRYLLDANINKTDILWIETEDTALIVRFPGDGRTEIEYEQEQYTGDFDIETGGGKQRIRFISGPSGVTREVTIGRQLLFAPEYNAGGNRLESITTPGGKLDAAAQEPDKPLAGSAVMKIGEQEERVYFTFGRKGFPESLPGEPFNKNDWESIEELRMISKQNTGYVSDRFEKTEFGDTLFLYVPLPSAGRGNADMLLCMEIWAREARRYRVKVLAAAVITTAAAFLLSVVVYILMIEKLVVVSIKTITAGIEQVAAGNLDSVIKMKRKDEIGMLADTFNHMTAELKEKELIKDLFGKYVQKEVAERAIASELKLGGDKQSAAVLFCDIRGFTTLSEMLDAEELVALLNRYFSALVEQISANGGVLDKYIGDALMAHFGVLGEQSNSADHAVSAAAGMRKALKTFNAEQKTAGGPEIDIGVGIHYGGLIAGNMGSPNRMEYTVIGDTVNLASRVEGLTRTYGAGIIITSSVYSLLKTPEAHLIRPIGSATVKGKSKSVELFEIFDDDGPELRRIKNRNAAVFQQVLPAYRAGDFEAALKILLGLGEDRRKDPLAEFYITRCRYLLEHPPGAAWDGSTVMHKK